VNFSTSSTIRGAENVFWTLPNVDGFEKSAEPAWNAQFGWLNRLNTSNRNVRKRVLSK